MKKKNYESAVLINASLDDEQIKQIISRIKEVIANNAGELQDFEDWGRKRLAYMVKKSKIGYYAIFRFNAPAGIVSKLERFYSLDESILRYLTIELSNDALEQIEKNKVTETPVAPAPPVVESAENNSDNTDEIPDVK